MDLSDEIEAYAVYVNAVIHHPEDEELWEDLAKAKTALEVAYLENLAEGALTAGPREPPLPQPGFDPEIGWTTSSDAGAW